MLPATALLALALVSAALGFLSEGSAGRGTPRSRGEPLDPRPVAVRGVVQDINGDALTIATSERALTLRLVPSTTSEAIRPAGPDRLEPGDWLNAGAIPHDQTLFAITGIVIIPQELLEEPR